MNNFKFYWILLLFKGCLIKQKKLEVSTSSGSKDTNLGTYGTYILKQRVILQPPTVCTV